MTTSRSSALGLLSIVVALLLVEGLARIGYTLVHDDAQEQWFSYSPELGWERRPGYAGSVYGAHRKFDDRGFVTTDSAQLDDHDEPRIFFVGDSCTFGYGVPTDQTFVELLDELLPEASAINLGVPGYSSYQGYRLLERDSELLEPDIVVVSFSFNDRRYVLTDDDVDSPALFRRIGAARTDQLLEHIYVYRMLGTIYSRLVASEPPPRPRIDTLPVRVSPLAYRENLRAIARLAREREFELVFMTLADNPVHEKYLDDGIAALAAGDYRSAIALLKMAVRKDNGFSALARRYLAEAYFLAQEPPTEKELLRLPKVRGSLHGGSPIRRDAEYARVMRDVAAEFGVPVVDLAKVLDENVADYSDIVHFDANGHLRAALLLQPVLLEAIDRRARRASNPSPPATDRPANT